MAMSDQARSGWVIGLLVVVVGLTVVGAYMVQQNQSLKTTLQDAQNALTVAQAQRTEAEQARANVPAEATALALLPVAEGATVHEVRPLTETKYRVWRDVSGRQEWWTVDIAKKSADKVDDVTFAVPEATPTVERVLGAEGNETVQFTVGTEVHAQTWSPAGELRAVLHRNGLQAKLRAGESSVTFTFVMPEKGCTPTAKTLPLTALEVAQTGGPSAAVTVTPPVLLTCDKGAVASSPWSTVVQATSSPENTKLPGTTTVWRLPLLSSGERDRYIEISQTFDPQSLFLR